MFKVSRINDDRLNLELDGKFDASEMEAALDEFVRQSEGIKNGKMLYEIEDFGFPSLGAIGVKFSRLPSLFALIGKFEKAAIVTDKKWLQRASEIEGLLIPGLEIKAFSFSEKTEAEAWLSDSKLLKNTG